MAPSPRNGVLAGNESVWSTASAYVVHGSPQSPARAVVRTIRSKNLLASAIAPPNGDCFGVLIENAGISGPVVTVVNVNV